MIYYQYCDFSKLEFDKKICTNIFTFDIETSNIIKLYGNIIQASKYQNLNEKEKEDSIFLSYMYIWMFSIDEDVYYGRTWSEFYEFLTDLELCSSDARKIVFVHNLSFEFQFLRSIFYFEDVFAREKRHIIKCMLQDFNIELRCSLTMSGVSLDLLAKTYRLPVKKLVGNLDYDKIRNSKTPLTENELAYCENDCLVVYYYIKLELETYIRVDKIPITKTGHVRRELRKVVSKSYNYKCKVKEAYSTTPQVYNMLCDVFQGGYTHANFMYTDKIIDNVDSFDFSSSYPFVMLSEKYPMKAFKPIQIKDWKKRIKSFAYLLEVEFKGIKSKYYNNIISMSKCQNIKGGRYDNGRIISADSMSISLTDIDMDLIFDFYKFDSYEIKKAYYSLYKYLPDEFYNFILEKYKKKTELKNVEGKEIEYAIEKANFNSLYGMTVTNNIRDEIIYSNKDGWSDRKLDNFEIQMKLIDEKDKGFLSFAWGVWVTAYARRNLLNNVRKLDSYVIYCDTDSIKLIEGYDISIIDKYNENVKNKIIKASNQKGIINFEQYAPKDIKGISHLIGVFEKDAHYNRFITQGAKKYAYEDESGEIHITVSGIPKKGSRALKKLEDFKDDMIFKHEDTGKNMLMYNDEQEETIVIDYLGNEEIRRDKLGGCIVPATYQLGKSLDYAITLNDFSSERAKFDLTKKLY